MAATTTTTQLINLTRFPRFNLHHFSVNNVHILHHQPFPSKLYYNHRSNLKTINCNCKLNNSSGGEPYEIDVGVFGGYNGIEDESDEDDEESNVDLLIKFLNRYEGCEN
ncbi:hypothetical protein MtrunA17_Chr1g0213191 [Medicago truncatula]|uniref:Uncharacterized protein n=1 Tax=Medicago truncatula TaxID=3880 RepID=G7IF20_MEDTR|nr:uncharacterized protein LOC11446746 [Medicago truncatula]AES63036.2 hypothetical protein MTR_1g116050 [Medicago truncatula]RHN82756.1 hypothetical protein MtrunA17_Chr1g0213191 [Medicago truncatula]